MTADVLTLMGTKKRLGPPKSPTPRLITCPTAVASRDLVPLNNTLLALEAEMRRLWSLLGGDEQEWMDNLETLSRKVMGYD
jgi:hypothetical protein